MFSTVRPGEYELVVKRSRFIAIARTAESRDQAKAFAAELKKEHREARHVCYGFIADEQGLDFGYDDDGEPSGTAGKPIYQALEASGARRSMIAVVRYFGGIKLGVGGLTRAYREAATAVIEKCGLIKTEKRIAYGVECDGETYRKVQPVLRNMGCSPEQILYNEKVSFTVTAGADMDVTGALEPLGATVKRIGDRYAEVN